MISIALPDRRPSDKSPTNFGRILPAYKKSVKHYWKAKQLPAKPQKGRAHETSQSKSILIILALFVMSAADILLNKTQTLPFVAKK